MFPCRACRLWSAPYDGINPSPQQYRSDTPGNGIEEEEELIQLESLAITPPLIALSPTPSSSDTVSTSNQTGRASSALELEWDDIFADDDFSLLNGAQANESMTLEIDRCTSTPAPSPLPPRHIQEMCRTATKLVHGLYVEESEFQNDVLVYDLIAQKDTKAAMLERKMAVNRQARGSITNIHRMSAAGRTVIETVNSIMSSRRRSEDGGKEESRWSEFFGKELRRRSEDFGKEMWRRKEEGENEMKRIDKQVESKGCQLFTNGFNAKHHIIDECDDTDEDGEPLKQSNVSDLPATINHMHALKAQHTAPCLMTNALPNGHSESEPHDPVGSSSGPGSKVTTKDDFLSQYRELMQSLGVEPDFDEITDEISTFRKRVRAVRQKLEEGADGRREEFVLNYSMDVQEEEREEHFMDEEEEEEDEEGKRSSSKTGNRRHGVPFTGQNILTQVTGLIYFRVLTLYLMIFLFS